RLHQRLFPERQADRGAGGDQARGRDRARDVGDHLRGGVRPMLEPVSVGLKFGFLAVLYLFLLWVAWSALRDLRRGRGAATAPEPSPADATSMYSAAAVVDDLDQFEPRLVVDRAPGHEPGMA